MKIRKNLLLYVRKHFSALLMLVFSLILAYTVSAYLIIERYSSQIYTANSFIELEEAKPSVAIVFGGGIYYGVPRPLLRDRLDTAQKLLESGQVKKLILSGDNRSIAYNEPEAMIHYLVSTYNTPREQLQADYAGRSTYETCERANRIFGLKEAVLISETLHLPRAIYLCERFNINSYGVQSNNVARRGLYALEKWREILARNKALFNVYVVGENTVLGEPIEP